MKYTQSLWVNLHDMTSLWHSLMDYVFLIIFKFLVMNLRALIHIVLSILKTILLEKRLVLLLRQWLLERIIVLLHGHSVPAVLFRIFLELFGLFVASLALVFSILSCIGWTSLTSYTYEVRATRSCSLHSLITKAIEVIHLITSLLLKILISLILFYRTIILYLVSPHLWATQILRHLLWRVILIYWHSLVWNRLSICMNLFGLWIQKVIKSLNWSLQTLLLNWVYLMSLWNIKAPWRLLNLLFYTWRHLILLSTLLRSNVFEVEIIKKTVAWLVVTMEKTIVILM